MSTESLRLGEFIPDLTTGNEGASRAAKEAAGDGDPCPICWRIHHGTAEHHVVASAPCGDERALIDALAALGVPPNRRLDRDDSAERSYGLLRMLDDAAGIGFDCSEVGGVWMITAARGLSDGFAA